VQGFNKNRIISTPIWWSNSVKARSSPSSLYRTLNAFLKEKHGCRVYKIAIDAGFSCPHRSKNRISGGCSYCNPRSFMPHFDRSSLTLSNQITNGIDFLKKRYNAKKYIAYFQSYTNTLASAKELRSLYQEALGFEDIIGLSIGTRPDCLPFDILDLLQEISQKTFLMMEIGLESANDNTLNKIKRNHTVRDFTRAISELTKRSIFTCAHVILGLPGEDITDMIKTANYLSKIGVNSVKIHHFHVVKGAELEKEYNENKIKTLTFERYKQIVIKFLEHLDSEIIIDRLVGDCPDEFLIAPKWELGKPQILREIKNDMLRLGARQGTHCP